MKALALFSGGLDSSLAIKVLQLQGIEIIALNFVSYFFGGVSERVERSASELGVKLEYIPFQEEQLEVVKNPFYGYGKHLNPCIDCHGLMIRIAGTLLKKYKASFVITGEVLGQRPKSQNYKALTQVESLSAIEGLVLRPLSAKLLPMTIPEREGWVNREQLLSFQGRSRKPQLALAKELGVSEYFDPGGGCLLTDSGFSKRMKVLKEDGFFDEPKLFELIRSARFLHLEKGKFLLVGRNEASNERLEENTDLADHRLIAYPEYPGPTILGFGDLSARDLDFMLDVFSRYSKSKGKSAIPVELDGQKKSAGPVDTDQISQKILELNIV